MAEKRWGVNNSTVVFLADFIRSVLGTTDPIPGAQLDPQLREAVAKVGSGGGGGGGSLPAGVYLSAAYPGVSPTYFRHQLFWFKGELYATSDESIHNVYLKAIYKWDGSAWTKLLSATGSYGINGTRLSGSDLAGVEFNGKMHFFSQKYHALFDGITFTVLNDLPNKTNNRGVFLHQGKLVAWANGTLYEWEEDTDTWTSLQVTLGDNYDPAYFYEVNGEIYAVKSKKVYHYTNGAMEQVSVADAPTTFSNGFAYNGSIYYINSRSTASDVYRYDFDTNEWSWVSDIPFIGLMFFTIGGSEVTFSAAASNASSHYFTEFSLTVVEASE